VKEKKSVVIETKISYKLVNYNVNFVTENNTANFSVHTKKSCKMSKAHCTKDMTWCHSNSSEVDHNIGNLTLDFVQQLYIKSA
jgi:hypothetical protein